MTDAAGVVRQQAELLDTFHDPDPDAQGMRLRSTMGDGTPIDLPLSLMGRMVDLVTLGHAINPAAWLRATRGQAGTFDLDTARPIGRAAGAGPRNTVAPMVAAGLTRARAYRVQENMTEPLMNRADGLDPEMTFGLGDDEVCPPRLCGFALLCEPASHYRKPVPGQGIRLVTWVAVVDPDLTGRNPSMAPTDLDDVQSLSWVTVVWDDTTTTEGWASVVDPITRRSVVLPGARFVPMAGYVIEPGTKVGPAWLTPKRFGEAPVRNPLHAIAALWQMLDETIPRTSGDVTESVHLDDEHLDKRPQRRARVSGVEDPRVTTVVLRREYRPVQNPGTGKPHTSRVEIEEYTAWRWVGPRNSPERKRVRRTVRKHWSSNDETLPTRERTVVSELRR